MDNRKVILICSIAGIICFFLPFFSIGESFIQFGISGWDIIKGLIDLLFGSSNGTGRLGSLLIGKTGGKFGFYAILLIFVLSGPIVFTVLFSRIIYKLQTGRILSLSYVYPVVYTAVAFVTLDRKSVV